MMRGPVIRVATILLGISVNAGFTNVQFQNEYIDYSPFEKDPWGNIVYIEGIKINTYSGTADLPITDYDILNRLFVSLGGKTVIVNGSDNTEDLNEYVHDVFDSTRLIGRVRNFALSTSLRNKKLGEMATYTFKIEEDI